MIRQKELQPKKPFNMSILLISPVYQITTNLDLLFLDSLDHTQKISPRKMKTHLKKAKRKAKKKKMPY